MLKEVEENITTVYKDIQIFFIGAKIDLSGDSEGGFEIHDLLNRTVIIGLSVELSNIYSFDHICDPGPHNQY